MRTPLTTFFASLFLLAAAPSHAAPPAPHLTVGADIKQLLFDWDGVAGATHYRLLQKVGSGSFRPLIDNIPASNTQVTLSVAVHLHSWSLLRYAVAACDASGCTNSNTVFPQSLRAEAVGFFKASNPDVSDALGEAVALSDDGRTLAVAASHERSNASGVNGNQNDNSSPNSGAVYVYRRVTGGWRQEAYLKAGVNQPNQRFGSSSFFGGGGLALNGTGTILAVGAPDQNVNGILRAGVVYVYQRSSSGTWTLAATLQSPAPSRVELFGYQLDMSLDGRTLKVNAFGLWEAPDGNPWFRTHIFTRPGTTWQHSASLGGVREGDYCESTRLSRDGATLVAICDNFFEPAHLETFKRSGDLWTNVSVQPHDWNALYVGLALDLDASRMVLQEFRFQQLEYIGIYEWTGGAWTRTTGLLPSNTPQISDLRHTLVLNKTGDLIAMAHMGGGKVDLWRRDNRTGSWLRRAAVTSPNPGGDDLFGSALAICGTGHAMAVGAHGNSSGARGVDGDRTDTSVPGSGAVWLH